MDSRYMSCRPTEAVTRERENLQRNGQYMLSMKCSAVREVYRVQAAKVDSFLTYLTRHNTSIQTGFSRALPAPSVVRLQCYFVLKFCFGDY